MSELITLHDICKIYNPGENEVRALDHVDLHIDENEFVIANPLSFVISGSKNT